MNKHKIIKSVDCISQSGRSTTLVLHESADRAEPDSKLEVICVSENLSIYGI